MKPRGPRGVALVAFLVAASCVVSGAHAAAPSKAECLGASEAWVTLRREGKLQDARAQLLVCASASCPSDVRQECAARVPEVNAAMPSVVFAATDASGRDVTSVDVWMDGRPLADKLDGTAIVVDPGEHMFRFETAGAPPTERRLVIHEGEKDRKETIALVTPPEASAPLPPQPPTALEKPPGDPSRAGGGIGERRIVALAITALGLGGVAAGAVFGQRAMAKWSDAQASCGSGCGPDAPAQQDKRDADSAARIADVAFAAGGVALVTAAVLWFTAPPAPNRAPKTAHALRVSPALGMKAAGVEVRGAF